MALTQMVLFRFITVLVLAAHCFSAIIVTAQSVGGRNSSWTPYRPVEPVKNYRVAESSSPSHKPTATIEVTPSQYVMCEPCEPVYSDVISDLDLEQMRPCQPGCVGLQQMCTQPMCVNPTNGMPMAMPVQGEMMPYQNIVAQGNGAWSWELLPGDVIWHSYWAGVKESRMSGVVFQELSDGMTLLDVTLGGRASIVRYGTRCHGRPMGWELQIEGAGMPRINLDENWDLEAADFRFGMPLIYGAERVQWKLSYYHLSSHLGDEYIERTGIPASDRVNYARDEIILGFSFFPLPAWRWYAEGGWAFYANEGADPWEFQFGLDYAQPGPTGCLGTPFFAVNGYLREELDFGGSFTGQAGWLWRGYSGKVLRTGVHYYNGKSSQFAFNGPLEQFEQQIGMGLWYDF
ncbi:DUF1207 domain-containing protein [Bythopirellula polymerisocia]|nr:DUF1207 domain-containing protein [Bythopirellula polymerisocia]